LQPPHSPAQPLNDEARAVLADPEPVAERAD